MLTVAEAARRAGRSPQTIRRWIRDGKLPVHDIGTHHLIEEVALRAVLDDRSDRRTLAAGMAGHGLGRADAGRRCVGAPRALPALLCLDRHHVGHVKPYDGDAWRLPFSRSPAGQGVQAMSV